MDIPKIQKPQEISQGQQGQKLYRGPDGQTGTKEQADSIFRSKVAERTKERTEGIQAHEDLHESVAGKYAMSKTINFGSDQVGNPIATSGRVMINMPKDITFKAPMEQIKESEEQAKIVAASAIAPAALGGEAGELSPEDEAVYSQAQSALGKASSAKSQRSSFESQIASKQGKAPDKSQELSPDMLNKANDPKKADANRKPLNIMG